MSEIGSFLSTLGEVVVVGGFFASARTNDKLKDPRVRKQLAQYRSERAQNAAR